ncbi:MAG TPA: MASE1 domain-containing protein, partial [Rhizomicrobium sp.]
MVALNITGSATRGSTVSPVTLLATMLGVFAACAFVVALARYTGSVDGIWISNAILLAMLLKHPRRDWLPIAAAGFLGNMFAGLLNNGLPFALFYSTLNLIEVTIVAWPLRRFMLDRDFTRPSALLTFYG